MKIFNLVACVIVTFPKDVVCQRYNLELFSTLKTEDEARRACESRNAWLVEIKNEKLNEAVQSLIGSNSAFIGLKHSEGKWQWGDGSDLRYRNWNSNTEPVVDNAHPCTYATSNGWFAVACSETRGYVCQSDSKYPGSFEITFHTEKSTYTEANQACTNSGSKLVDDKTEALHEYLIGKRRSLNYNFRIGGCGKSSTDWRWSDGTAIDLTSSYWLYWHRDNVQEPNDGAGACMGIYKNTGNGKIGWNDFIPSDRSSGYACQKNVTSGPCLEDMCSGNGVCKVSGIRYHCSCHLGYTGTKCETEMLNMNVIKNPVRVNKGVGAEIKVAITSYASSVNITLREKESTTILSEETVLRSVHGIHGNSSMWIPIVLSTSQYVIQVINSDFHNKTLTVTIEVTDHCQSNPCKPNENCDYSTTHPFYNCSCKPEYFSASCTDYRFTKLGMCKYYVSRLIQEDFASVNSSCANMNGSLAMLKTSTIQDKIEEQIIEQYGNGSSTIRFWIGGYETPDGQWLWMDGTSIKNSQISSNVGQQGLVLTSQNTTRNVMKLSGHDVNSQITGRICEVPDGNICEAGTCKNNAKCLRTVGCLFRCECTDKGYDGDLCEIQKLSLLLSERKYVIKQQGYIRIKANVTSKIEGYDVEVLNSSSTDSSIFKKSNVTNDTLQISIGPILVQTVDSIYTLRVTPTKNPGEYYRIATIEVQVQGPPTVYVSPEYLILSDANIRQYNMTCYGTGVPLPTIHWVDTSLQNISTNASENMYQVIGGGQSVLYFHRRQARHGKYVCIATSKVVGVTHMRNRTVFVLEKLRLLANSTKISQKLSEPSSYSCSFKGYPDFKIVWMMKNEGNETMIKLNLPGSIFREKTALEETKSLIINKTSSLTVALPNYLNATYISCHAENEYDDSGTTYFSLNQNLFINNNHTRLYRLYYESEKKNYTESKLFCGIYGMSLLKIPDEYTQNLVARKIRLEGLNRFAFLGAQRSIEENNVIWKWNDGILMYNETAKGSMEEGKYTNWRDGHPNSSELCVAAFSGIGYWHQKDCKKKTNLTICEAPIDGDIKSLHVSRESCGTSIFAKITGVLHARNVTHRIIATEESTSRIINTTDIIPIDETPINLMFSDLKNGSRYTISVVVCPSCPIPYRISKSISTQTLVAAVERPISQATKSLVGKRCVVKWNLNSTSDGVTGFKINVTEELARPISSTSLVTLTEKTYHENGSNMSLAIASKPNRKYIVRVRTVTCLSEGIPVETAGVCITKIHAPEIIPIPRVLISNNVTNLNFEPPDETNGPVSCIFVLVTYDPVTTGNNQTNFTMERLRTAAEKSRNNVQIANDIYLAIAIERSAFANQTQISRHLGDGTSSQCHINVSVNRNPTTRQKRYSIISESERITANNRNIENGKQYNLFILTMTQDDDEIYFKSSVRVSFTTPPANLNQANTSIALVAGIAATSVIILVFLVIFTAFMLKRRQDTESSNDSLHLQELEQNEEHAYANFAAESDNPKSETDIPLADLLGEYSDLISDGKEKARLEFANLKEEAKKLPYVTKVASNPQLKTKNRYKNILPHDEFRVALNNESGDGDYINACYIKGYKKPKKFIATQGPLPGTVNDFWRMVVEQNCSVIAMLTKCQEGPKVKCEKYWPARGSSNTYGAIVVKCIDELSYGSYLTRIFKVTTTEKSLTVYHFQFLNWPDHGIPTTTSNIIRFYKAVMEKKSKHPIIVHCSAGVGRTGAFIAYDILIEESKSRKSVDIFDCVIRMRRHRVDMVQTYEQFILIHRLILELHLFGNTEYDGNSFQAEFEKNSRIEKEFADLDVVGPIDSVRYMPVDGSADASANNHLTPYEKNRVIVVIRQEETYSPYINASCLEGYDSTFSLIAARAPTKSGIETFWRAVFDNNVRIIVMLTRCKENDEIQCAQYWSENGEKVFPIVKITSQSTSTTGVVTVRKMTLELENEERTITHYQFTGWSHTQNPEPSELLNLVNTIRSQIVKENEAVCLVHCSDGIGRTGSFCAIMNLISRLNSENKADVFRAAKDLRDCRPGMIQTLDQYRICYEVVSAHLASPCLYMNVQALKNEVSPEEENPYQNL